jgi:transketolase
MHRIMIDTETFAKEIRIKSIQMVHKAHASHIGSALSIADIVAVLYGSIMQYIPDDPMCTSRDRFILSKGHACVAVYSALALVGFFPVTDLETYGDDFSWLMNHISHKVPGVEFSTGALGHGLPFSAGKALAAKVKKKSWRVFTLLSDGEMDEGSNWEALMFAAHHKLSNLTIIIDYNKLQSLGTVSSTLGLEPLTAKLRAFGAHTIDVDGHNHLELKSALSYNSTNQPVIVIAHTIKGKGVEFMQNKVAWHYKTPNDSELSAAMTELESNHA